MMQGARLLERRIHPGLHHFQHEEVVAVHQTRIHHATFQTGIAFGDQWRLHLARRLCAQTEPGELVGIAARAVADGGDPARQFGGGDVEHAFAGLQQCAETVVAAADHAAHQRRVELHHGVPGLCHDVVAAALRGGQQQHGAGFQQAIDLG